MYINIVFNDIFQILGELKSYADKESATEMDDLNLSIQSLTLDEEPCVDQLVMIENTDNKAS